MVIEKAGLFSWTRFIQNQGVVVYIGKGQGYFLRVGRESEGCPSVIDNVHRKKWQSRSLPCKRKNAGSGYRSCGSRKQSR